MVIRKVHMHIAIFFIYFTVPFIDTQILGASTIPLPLALRYKLNLHPYFPSLELQISSETEFVTVTTSLCHVSIIIFSPLAYRIPI